MSFVVANGVRFNVLRIGHGEGQVVFLHGMVMDSLSSWYLTVANPIARKWNCLLYDMRGHGLSERTDTGYSVDEALDDLIAILDECDVKEPSYFVGNSYGGLLALALAIRRPDLVAGMILVEAHFAVEGWAHNTAATLEFAGLGLQHKQARDILEELDKRHYTRRFHKAEALIEKTTLIEDVRASSSLAEDDLRAVKCPALALYGADSDIIDRGRELAELLPNCDLRVLEDAKHTILTHNTKWVRSEMIDWLEAQRDGGASEEAAG